MIFEEIDRLNEYLETIHGFAKAFEERKHRSNIHDQIIMGVLLLQATISTSIYHQLIHIRHAQPLVAPKAKQRRRQVEGGQDGQ